MPDENGTYLFAWHAAGHAKEKHSLEVGGFSAEITTVNNFSKNKGN